MGNGKPELAVAAKRLPKMTGAKSRARAAAEVAIPFRAPRRDESAELLIKRLTEAKAVVQTRDLNPIAMVTTTVSKAEDEFGNSANMVEYGKIAQIGMKKLMLKKYNAREPNNLFSLGKHNNWKKTEKNPATEEAIPI